MIFYINDQFKYGLSETNSTSLIKLPLPFSTFFIIYWYSKMKGGDFMSGYVGGAGAGSGFALIVVLFILLIIVGAAYTTGGFGGY